MGIVMTPAGPVYVPGKQMQRPAFEVYDLPTIDGVIKEGATVTAGSAVFSNDPLEVSYTFLLMSGGIAVDSVLSANGSYVIPAGSAGYELRVRQFAKDEAGQRIRLHPSGVESEPYTVLAAGAPAFTADPTLSVERAEGATVTCLPGTITGSPVPAVSYQWFYDNVLQRGQTLNTWVIPTGARGKSFWCDVTATNIHGSVTLSSEIATVPIGITFPADIADNLWTVSEIRDSTEAAGVVGKRKLVLGAITVPAGFELRWASQAQADPEIRATLPVVTPSATFTNEFALAIGTENGNALYWRHVSSDPTAGSNLNAWKLAAPVRVITIQGISTTVEPPTLGSSDWLPMPLYTDAEAAANLPAGDGGQVMLGHHRNELDPNRLYAVQDVGAIRVSTDGGFKWNTLENFGLGSNFGLSVRSDRQKPNRLFALMGHRYDHRDNGIYISEDGGINWTKAHAYPNALGESRTGQRRISQSKSTTTRWYCILDSALGFAGNTANNATSPALLTSSQNGAAGTWTKVRDLPAATFGTYIWGCEPDPTSSSKLYAWGSNGLQRFENAANATGAVTNFSTGATGMLPLPVGSDGQVRSFNISADGNTLWIAVENYGLYRSTNGGTSWSQFKADITADYLAVNPAHPLSMWAWAKSQSKVQYTSNGGTSWTTCSVKDELGNNRGVQNEPYVIPDPRNSAHAHLYGSAYFYNTTSGTAFVRTQDGFLGYHHKNYAGDHSFTDDPLKFAFGMLDTGCLGTTNGMETNFIRPPYTGQKSGNGLAVNRDGSVILLAVDSETNGTLWRCTGYFTATPTWTQVRTISTKGRQWVGFGRGTLDASHAWQLNERSTDNGVTWAAMPNFPANSFIVGVSRSTISVTGGTRSVLYAADINNSGTKRKVFKSVDGGDTWTEAFDTGYDLSGARDFRIVFRVHPTEPHAVFTRGAPSSGISYIRKWNTSNNTSATLDLFNGTVLTVPEFRVDAFAIWAANPNYMIARSQGHGGTRRFLRVSSDAGASWSSIGAGIPTVTEGRGLEIHPVTGAIYYGSANGMFTRSLPGATADATPARLAARFPTRRSVHFSAAYGPTYPTIVDPPPPADDSSTNSPSSAAISAALLTPLRRHDESGNGTPGWSSAMGADFLALCLAARAGKTTVDDKIASYLSNIYTPNSGRDPICTGHYIAQMDFRTLVGLTVLKYTPRYWGANGLLTANMKRRITKSVNAGLFGHAWNVMDNQPNGTTSGNRTMRGLVKSTKSTGSNIALGPLACIINAICFHGSGEAVQTLMQNYDHATFRDSLIADSDGLQNAYRTFNSRNRTLSDGADGTLANVPTNTEMNSAIRGSWSYFGSPVTDLYGMLQLSASQGLSKALSKKIMWGKRDGVGCYLQGTTTPSGWGYMIGTTAQRTALPGLNTANSDLFEWDNTDAEGDRSAGQYASYTVATILGLIAVIRVSGLHDPNKTAWISMLRRINRMMLAYNYKAEHGYRSWSHGSSSGIHAGLWGKNQTETNTAVVGGWPGTSVDSYKAWGCEYAKSIWVDSLKPVLL